jgi:hypothetical protein
LINFLFAKIVALEMGKLGFCIASEAAGTENAK